MLKPAIKAFAVAFFLSLGSLAYAANPIVIKFVHVVA